MARKNNQRATRRSKVVGIAARPTTLPSVWRTARKDLDPARDVLLVRDEDTESEAEIIRGHFPPGNFLILTKGCTADRRMKLWSEDRKNWL